MEIEELYFYSVQKLRLAQFPPVTEGPEILAEFLGINYEKGSVEGASVFFLLISFILFFLSYLVNMVLLLPAIFSVVISISLLIIPNIFFFLHKVKFYNDLVMFCTIFLTQAPYTNIYNAFESAIKETNSPIFKRGLVLLEIGEVSNVSDSIGWLKNFTKKHIGYDAYTMLSIVEQEISKPQPAYLDVLKEIMMISKRVTTSTTKKFVGNLNLALGLVGVAPAMILTLLPFGFVMEGIGVNISYMISSEILFFINFMAMYLIASSLPVGGGSFDQQKISWDAVSKILDIKKINLPDISSYMLLVSTLFVLLGWINPLFFSAAGVALILFSIPSLNYERYLSRAVQEFPTLQEFVRIAGERLKRDNSLEQALNQRLAVAKAFKIGDIKTVLPFEEFLIVENMLLKMGEFGKSLGASLDKIADYIEGSISQKLDILQTFQSIRLTIFILLIFIPLLPTLIVYMVKHMGLQFSLSTSGSSSIISGSSFMLFMGELKHANLKLIAAGTLTVSFFTNLLLSVIASFASGVYYKDRYRFYCMISGVAFTITGIILYMII